MYLNLNEFELLPDLRAVVFRLDKIFLSVHPSEGIERFRLENAFEAGNDFVFFFIFFVAVAISSLSININCVLFGFLWEFFWGGQGEAQALLKTIRKSTTTGSINHNYHSYAVFRYYQGDSSLSIIIREIFQKLFRLHIASYTYI